MIPALPGTSCLEDTAMRRAIVAEAREWIGTPFRHQQSVKGAGCDCAGLVRGVAQACGAVVLAPGQWAPFASYGRQPRPDRMRAVLERFMVEIEAAAAMPGDVAWMAWREDLPMHLAILARHDRRLTVIHALSDFERVVEHGFTGEWRGRVNSWWRFPALARARGRA